MARNTPQAPTSLLNTHTGLTGFPSSPPTEKAIEVLKAALNKGVNCWNGAEFYGQEENSMTLLRAYFNKYPEDADKVTIVIKGGVDTETRKANGSPEFIRKSIDNILTQLGGKKKLDVFCIARRDARVDFGETLNLIQKEYVETGKVGAIAISECAAKTIHEAVKHVKIVAVEVELSMVSPDILKNGVADAAGQYGIPIIAYSPMGRGVSVPSHQE